MRDDARYSLIMQQPCALALRRHRLDTANAALGHLEDDLATMLCLTQRRKRRKLGLREAMALQTREQSQERGRAQRHNGDVLAA